MKKALIFILTLTLNSCSMNVTVESNRMYKVIEKIPMKNGYCKIYWFDEYKLRKNFVKCDSCYIGQKIGDGGLKL